MDDVRLGIACRAVRIRQHKTQAEVAEAAGARQQDVSRLERGLADDLPLGVVRRIAVALEMRLDLTTQWRGPELDRLINAAHAALQVAVLRRLGSIEGWVVVPEVSYSIFGERGAIDILAWHAETRTLLIVELKTVLVEAAGLVRTMHARTRLAHEIAKQQGWRPRSVARWVILTDTRTNRRHVAAHREILAPLTGLDGRTIRTWLAAPTGPITALSFWDEPLATVPRRVSKPRKRSGDALESPEDAIEGPTGAAAKDP